MIVALIGVVLLLIFILIAVRVGGTREKPDSEEQPVIHKSGIYSIVRKSPRETVTGHKPSVEELRKYLAGINEDMKNMPLSEPDKEEMIRCWNNHLENSITEIEQGDREGVEFYYYRFAENDPICKGKISKGHFITREQIYQYPGIVPPFHLGCTCELKKYSGEENLRDTTVVGMSSLFGEKKLPSLPDWKTVYWNRQ